MMTSVLQTITSSAALSAISIIAATYLIWGMFVIAVVVLFRSHATAALYSMIMAIAGVWIIQQFIGMWWFRARPFVEDLRIHNLINKSSLSKSFPSDHAAIGFVLATTVFMVLPNWGRLLYVCACIVAFGRIAVGVHYPSDVVVGALLGTLAAMIVYWITNRV